METNGLSATGAGEDRWSGVLGCQDHKCTMMKGHSLAIEALRAGLASGEHRESVPP